MKTEVVSKSSLRSRFGYSLSRGYSYDSVIRESLSKTSAITNYDVFLSHSHIDQELIFAFKNMLESADLTVYVDWLIESDRAGKSVTAANAQTIRTRMNQCSKMIYLHTKNASESKWCPWEVGFFDALKGDVTVALIDDNPQRTTGQEYLNLYPRFIASPNAVINKYSFREQTELKSDFAF